MRSTQQNRLYHEYCGQLRAHSVIKIYDGRFTELGISNPIVFRPSAFSYDTFRTILKSLDLEYPKYKEDKEITILGRKIWCRKDTPLHSPECTVEQMNSHILFLECLLAEI